MERDGAHSTLTSDDADISTHFDEDTQESKASLNFWTQLDMLRNGHLHVYSRFGFTAIRSRKQAEAFGNKLYMHLTNGNTIPFTSSTICEAMRHQLSSENTRCESLPYTCHPLTPDRFNNVDKGDMTDVVCHALRLFRCSESNSGLNSDVPVTQSTVVNAVVTVFKEIQFSRASLQDLKNLHESAKSVLDFIFYLFLLLLVQVILNVDISKILAPLLTILFGLSFAFSPVLSNLFLSMSFVMFLLPFNVGNRVIIGKTEKIMGNIFEMSLMHTTILTRHNEKLRIPNHQLFHEHITNLSDGMVSTFEISLVFALDGPLKCPQDKIHAFIRKIKNFAKEDNKSDWIDVIVFCDDINFGNNQATYTFWCTHRAGYHEVIRCYNGLTKMLEEMRRVQVELDIHFQKGLKLL
jgi:small-conductance mechanosensitive channel